MTRFPQGPRRPGSQHPLTAALQTYRSRCTKLQAQIAGDSWLSESYVSRLFSGEKTNPSREALILIGCYGMALAVEEVDDLLLAADYKQLTLPESNR